MIRILDERDIADVRSNSANAIKGRLTGAVVRTDDVSPLEHTPNVFVHGKNLFHFTKAQTGDIAGIMYSVEPNSSVITLNGTATKNYNGLLQQNITLTKGTYTISTKGMNVIDGSYDRIYVWDVKNESVIVNHIKPNNAKTFTLLKDTIIDICYLVGVGSTYENTDVFIQIEKGETATEYTPYIDPSTVELVRYGKNLFPNELKNNATITKGTTVTHNLDGSFTVDKKSGDTLYLYKDMYLPKGKYTISNGLKEGCKVYVQVNLGENQLSTLSTGQVTFETNGENARVMLYSSSDTELEVTLFPQLEIGEVATKYEIPITPLTVEVADDGTVTGLTSASPSMTLLSDTSGVIIECEYTKDTNMIIQKLSDAIVKLGGNVSL